LADESVDLIYLDPPFNSNRSYNALFKEMVRFKQLIERVDDAPASD
jgi:16S rRNA G966 N2-methylase RsmD